MDWTYKFIRSLFTACMVTSLISSAIIVALFVDGMNYASIAVLVNAAGIGIAMAGRNIIDDFLLGDEVKKK